MIEQEKDEQTEIIEWILVQIKELNEKIEARDKANL